MSEEGERETPLDPTTTAARLLRLERAVDGLEGFVQSSIARAKAADKELRELHRDVTMLRTEIISVRNEQRNSNLAIVRMFDEAKTERNHDQKCLMVKLEKIVALMQPQVEM